MKKFKYKTESYLKFVKFERSKALKSLNEAESYKMSLIKRYQYLENEMSKAYGTNSNLGKSIKDVNFINDNNMFILKIKETMEDLSQEIMMAEAEFQKRMEKLKEVQLKVRKIELHKELEKEKYDKALKKKVQKQLDDINSSRKWG